MTGQINAPIRPKIIFMYVKGQMCFNKEVSMTVFVFAAAVSINLLIEFQKTNEVNYIYAAMYLFLLAAMQLVEFFIHWYSSNKSGLVYQAASVAVLVTFVLQFIGMSTYLHREKILPDGTAVLDAMFYSSILYLFYKINKTNFNNENVCNSALPCKMSWSVFDRFKKWKGGYLYLLAFSIYLVYSLITTYYLFDTSVFAVYCVITTLILSLGVYSHFRPSIGQFSTTSIWCFYAVLLSVICIIIGSNRLVKT